LLKKINQIILIATLKKKYFKNEDTKSEIKCLNLSSQKKAVKRQAFNQVQRSLILFGLARFAGCCWMYVLLVGRRARFMLPRARGSTSKSSVCCPQRFKGASLTLSAHRQRETDAETQLQRSVRKQ